MKITKKQLKQIIREEIRTLNESPFNNAKMDFYNKKVHQFWQKSSESKRKQALSKAMPSVSLKFVALDYEGLTPEIRKRLYYKLFGK